MEGAPFGLTCAPATFQRPMEHMHHGLHWKSLLLYLDPDFQTHMQRLEEVFQQLQQARSAECELLHKEVKYLGHIVSPSGAATDPQEVATIQNWPTPKALKELQAFLGTVGIIDST